VLLYIAGGDVMRAGGAGLSVAGEAVLRRDALVYRFARQFALPLVYLVRPSATRTADAVIAQSVVGLARICGAA
jgi:hypothetical protein